LAVATTLIVALLSGCATSVQEAFRYPGQVQGKVAPTAVAIASDCKVSPDVVVNKWYPERVVVEVSLLTPLYYSRSQVLWHIVGKQAGDQVMISSEGAKLFRSPHSEGEPIQLPFPCKFEIPASFDAIRSGSLKAARYFLRDKNSYVIWTYSIDYLRDGKSICRQHSPEVCIQKWGSTGCSSSN